MGTTNTKFMYFAREWINSLAGALLVVALLFTTRSLWLPSLVEEAVNINRSRVTSADIPAAKAAELVTGSPFVGPKSAKSIIVFSDYYCSVCRAAETEINELAQKKNIRIYIRELPILGSNSTEAAKIALTASSAGKYETTRKQLFSQSGANGELAGYLGSHADIAERYASRSEQINAAKHIEASLKAAKELDIQGTPAFIIGGKLFRGWQKDKIQEAIENL